MRRKVDWLWLVICRHPFLRWLVRQGFSTLKFGQLRPCWASISSSLKSTFGVLSRLSNNAHDAFAWRNSEYKAEIKIGPVECFPLWPKAKLIYGMMKQYYCGAVFETVQNCTVWDDSWRYYSNRIRSSGNESKVWISPWYCPRVPVRWALNACLWGGKCACVSLPFLWQRFWSLSRLRLGHYHPSA